MRGDATARELVERGHEVTALTRSERKRAQLERLGARAAVADALDSEALAAAVRARLKRELGWRPRLPTYREALAPLA